MGDILAELVPLLTFLLPGFVATIIFYWLSDARKPGQFERVIQALIGTTLISLVMPLVKESSLSIGESCCALGAWTERSDTLAPLGVAAVVGLALAYAANHDTLYRLARVFGLTSRASHSDWAYAFRTRTGKFVVLQLLDGRRLIGYPEVWPTSPVDGHFLLLSPRWVKDDGSHYDDQGISCMIISSVDVHWVEILHADIKDHAEEHEICLIKRMYRRLLGKSV